MSSLYVAYLSVLIFMSSWNISGTMMEKILAALFMGLIAWAYRAIQPSPPKICGSPNGPPVTAPRIKLRDGRHLAYKEHGVPKDKANHKIVFVHGFDSCRHDAFPLSSVSFVSSKSHIHSIKMYLCDKGVSRWREKLF